MVQEDRYIFGNKNVHLRIVQGSLDNFQLLENLKRPYRQSLSKVSGVSNFFNLTLLKKYYMRKIFLFSKLKNLGHIGQNGKFLIKPELITDFNLGHSPDTPQTKLDSLCWSTPKILKIMFDKHRRKLTIKMGDI